MSWGAEGGGEDAEHDDRDGGRDGIVTKALQGLPATEPWHVEVEEDGLDVMLCCEDERLFAGDGFDDGVALADKVLGDDGADAGIVVADQNGAFTACWKRRGNNNVASARGAGKHDVERGS